jgi:RHS repeat-associated protein
VLLVDDVITTIRTHPGGVPYRTQPILRYQYGNHLGSVALELDEAAQIISYEEFHPYGTSAFRLMKAGTEAAPRRYRHTGMERDEESGLSYHTARYCLPWLGRWGSCDPSGIRDHHNLYAAVQLNPINNQDTNGLQTEPSNFVKYAATMEEGLLEIARLGEAAGKEYGLASDPANGRFLVLEGGNNSVSFGSLTPIAHTHTGTDLTVNPSTADLDLFAARGVSRHYIYSAENGWGRLDFNASTRSFEFVYIREGLVIGERITENPNFDPTDQSPVGRANRWTTAEIARLPINELRVSGSEASTKGPKSPVNQPNLGRPTAPSPEPEARPAEIGESAASGSIRSRMASVLDSSAPIAALKALAVAALVYAAYDIQNKAVQTTRDKGALMGAAQVGKTTTKHATAALWFAVGLSVTATILTLGTAGPFVAVAAGAFIAAAGTEMTHNVIDEMTPGLR